MRKNVIVLVVALLFGATKLQSQKLIQPSQDTAGKTPFFIFNPSFSTSLFYYQTHSKERDFEWWASGPGVRLSASPERPNFFFIYADISFEKYREENFVGWGRSVISEEKNWVFEAGFGVAGSIPLFWGLGFDGEVTVPVTSKPIPTLGAGLSWGIGNFFMGFQNLVTCDQPGLWNPCAYVGYSHSFEFRRKK